MNIAQRLCLLIDERGVSRGKVARAVNVHTSTVTNWLDGKEPKAESLVKLAEYFGVSVSYLTGETSDRNDRSLTHWAELEYGQKNNSATIEGNGAMSDLELLEAFRNADETTQGLIRKALGLK